MADDLLTNPPVLDPGNLGNIHLPIDTGALVLMGAFVVIAVALIMVLDKKYPRRTIFVYEKGVRRFVTVRINEHNQILENNIMQLLMPSMRAKPRETITDFGRVFIPGKGTVYEAGLIRGCFVPITAEADSDTTMKAMFNDVGQAKRVAERYFDALDYADTSAKTVEPLTAAILANLPTAIVIVCFLIGVYFATGSLIDLYKTNLELNKQVATQLSAASDKLSLMLSSAGVPKNVYYNASAIAGK